ncbi:MAG TPA: 3-deoxy-D-manno-octulosonic acid transferase [Acidobacteriaceae bacterium]|jgi:3-deoxy-D-manno-octulosonic-acid transferase|nr:3-deoxy-D-manno-octulosonic acid transferase [Acidobacteriaceae bacterium]
MILFLYNLGLLLALLLGAPWWLWRMATTEKYREGLRARLGGVPERFAERHLDAAKSKIVSKPVLWLHAVSVGEVLAVSRLVAELNQQLPEFRVLVSTTTRTGQIVARVRFGPERVFYCPLDLPWAVTAYLDALKPAMLVLAETEFWPNLLSGCFRRGIPVAVVNARISDRSWPRYLRLRRLWRPFLSRLSAVLAQSDIDAERLRALGCLPERVMMSGNLKFDVRAAGDSEAVRLLGKLRGGLRLVVAGSTLDGEEAMLLQAWSALLAADPNLGMVLAPRHPERFAAVEELLQRSGFPWRKRSSLRDAALIPGEIVLLDSIGELASIYSLAAVAFIGGSLVAEGGHNPLEPAQFGVPVVMGEHYANFRSIVEAMRSQEAIAIASSDRFAEAVASLLRDPEAAAQMGERGRQVFEQQAGATQRTVAALREILSRKGTA